MQTRQTQSDKAQSMTVSSNAGSTGLLEGKLKAVYMSWRVLAS